jgi:hypothetical protein
MEPIYASPDSGAEIGFLCATNFDQVLSAIENIPSREKSF